MIYGRNRLWFRPFFGVFWVWGDADLLYGLSEKDWFVKITANPVGSVVPDAPGAGSWVDAGQ